MNTLTLVTAAVGRNNHIGLFLTIPFTLLLFAALFFLKRAYKKEKGLGVWADTERLNLLKTLIRVVIGLLITMAIIFIGIIIITLVAINGA